MFSAPAVAPPLSLYIHFPWCVRKCPYCDFNSHALNGASLPEMVYIEALLLDLERSVISSDKRPLRSIFFGGGTPNLFSPPSIEKLLDAIARTYVWERDIEITLEANPGFAGHRRFADYRSAGVNRLSLGVQSLNDDALKRIGRIHNANEARAAIHSAIQCFDNVNLDFMFALPEQSMETLRKDIDEIIGYGVAHLSCYQLTIEPNTAFFHTPPVIPDEDMSAIMQEYVTERIVKSGYARYEVSAYAQPEKQCRHNLNYWQFGDYLALGAGAHGKYSFTDRIERTIRYPHPQRYMAVASRKPLVPSIMEKHNLANEDIGFEFMLNALRLKDGVPATLFEERTGLSADTLKEPLRRARDHGLIDDISDRWVTTEKGYRFLNETLQYFLGDIA
ncbi:MAG: radical SAM family heme chaperone HemW [Burkholderiales bacterium]|jgi:oxygen-independent coproporphyrinogen-3 oxidase|nr:radical SAM family heme chaperone HemW [Burkholderiales bacterium]